MKKEMLELQRTNVTPAQFAAYVRSQIRKHNLTCICAEDIVLDYWKKGGDLEFDYRDIPGKPAKAERSISKPYEMQTYVQNWDGTVYNFIMEFNFWDEKTGNGYFYFVNTWNEAEEAEEAEQAEATEETEEATEEERKEEKAMMTRETAVDAVLDYFKENEEEFNTAIEELDSYNGYLGDDRYYEMDMLDEFYHGVQPTEFLNRVFYGYDEDTSTENNYTEFNPNREYFRYNGYGNLVSADYKDYSAHLDTWFTESYIENADNLYDIPADVQAIIDSIEA